MNALNRYAQTQKQTASPERLMVLLFEKALRQMRTAAQDFERGRPASALRAAGNAMDIVAHLQETLRPDAAPELCRTLSDVYTFVLQRLTVGCAQRAAAPVQEAERAFAPVADGFGRAVAQRAAP